MNSTKRQCWNCKFLGRETSDAYICKHELLQTTEQGFGINFKKDITVNSYCSLFESRIIYWFSRHPLTNGQKATISRHFGNIEIEQKNVIFNNQIIEQIQEITNQKTIALVAPLKYGLILLRAGYTIIEFENISSARQKGVFLCKGMNIHTLRESRFIPCPLSPEEQEEGELNYNTAR